MFNRQAKHAQIALENPCTESPDNMRPIAGGQFCNTCQKQVTDFTNFSDEEFIRYFQTHKTPGCGKFDEHQFSLQIPPANHWQPFHKIMKPAAALLVSLSLCSKANAQIDEKPHTIQAEPTLKSTSVKQVDTNLVHVHGTVFKESGAAAEGACVVPKGATTGTITDEHGEFDLMISDQVRTIVINLIGSKPAEVTVNADDPMTVILKNEERVLTGEVNVYYGGYRKYLQIVPAKQKAKKAKKKH